MLKAIPLIIAVVSSEIEIYDGKTYKLDFKKANYSKNDYIKFMRKSGIFDLLEKHVISNIYDYILGIMVGLDTYSRKNRSSYYIQKILKDVLESSGYLENINVFFDISVDQIKQQFNIDLRLINLSNSYRFDAVLKKKGKLYLIECNYFSSIGSKINEIVKNNVQLSKKLRDNFDVEFMWIIDGPGCEHSKIIEEAFDSIFYIFNLHDLENHVLEYYI